MPSPLLNTHTHMHAQESLLSFRTSRVESSHPCPALNTIKLRSPVTANYQILWEVYALNGTRSKDRKLISISSYHKAFTSIKQSLKQNKNPKNQVIALRLPEQQDIDNPYNIHHT